MTEMELIKSGLSAYRQALEAGMTADEAKQFAYAEVPGMRPILGERKWLTHWGNGIKTIKIEFGLSPRDGRPPKANPAAAPNGGNGNARREAFVRTSSGRINITDSLLAYLERKRPAVGTELHLGDIDLWGSLIGATPTGITMPFRYYADRQQVGLNRDGWRFEIVNPSYRCFTVRVVAAPAPPPEPEPPAPPAERTYTAAEVQALFAEFMAKRA